MARFGEPEITGVQKAAILLRLALADENKELITQEQLIRLYSEY